MNKKLIAGLLAITILGSLSAPSFADRKIPGHPRVNEVNGRRENQHDRIQRGIKNGTIGKGEAKQLRQEGRDIHNQEKAMRKQDGGHLTKADQKMLNKEQNVRSKQIYQDKHDGNK